MENKHCIEFKSPSLNLRDTRGVVEVIDYDPQKHPHVAWYVGGKLLYSTEFVKLFNDLKFSAKRTAIYECEGLQLNSPEHLASVFLMWPHHRFNVKLDVADPSYACTCGTTSNLNNAVNVKGTSANLVGEVPLMDGSAVPFLTALRKQCGVPEELAFYDAPIRAEWDLTNNEGCKFGHVRMMPAETFEVEYVMDKTAARDGYDLQSAAYISLYAPENLYQLYMARTFISAAELESARKQGLLSGVDNSCGLVLGEKFRIANEPAMHKILDLIGDLAFVLPALPRVRIEITNGGHVSHRQIMEKLIPYVSLGIFNEV